MFTFLWDLPVDFFTNSEMADMYEILKFYNSLSLMETQLIFYCCCSLNSVLVIQVFVYGKYISYTGIE
jgi:hypothetical protein